jgi:hypothetical protein
MHEAMIMRTISKEEQQRGPTKAHQQPATPKKRAQTVGQERVEDDNFSFLRSNKEACGWTGDMACFKIAIECNTTDHCTARY